MNANLESWRKAQRSPFVFKSKKHGQIRLHRFLRAKDFSVLITLVNDTSLTPRDFTIQVLNQVALQTPIENLREWDDKTILMVAKKWAIKVFSDETDNITIGDFLGFKQVSSNYIEKISQSMSDAIKSVNAFITDQIKPQLDQMLKAITDVFSNMQIIQSAIKPLLPEFSDFFASVRDTIENEKKTREILKLSEYELAPLIINNNELFDINNKKLFHPMITKKLVQITRKDEFAEEVSLLFSSPRLQKRLSAITQALKAHKNREYYLSVPVFLAQSEGIFTDWLIALRLVHRKEGDIIVHNEKRKLNSLKPKIKFAVERNIAAEGLLKIAMEDVLMRTTSIRNAVLHGEKSNYGTAKNSLQTLLLVLIFAGVLESEPKLRKKR